MKKLKNIFNFYKNIWFSRRFFIIAGLIILLFAISFALPILFIVAQAALVLLAVITLVDVFVMHHKKELFTAQRHTQKLLSNGDKNPIKLQIENQSGFSFDAEIYDELPQQLQKRDFYFNESFKGHEKKTVQYHVRPTERGAYHFGDLNLFLTSKINLIKRRIIVPLEQEIGVYPSIIQMKKFELKALEKASHFYGIKKLRRIGQSYEFEQIRNYVKGDDFRKINWKATSKTNSLMVNQYIEERSQSVYCIIDKSRNMKLPFYGLSLFDYAVNSSLVLSNVSLQKQDKAGLITFSKSIDTIVRSGNKSGQLQKILENLYNQTEEFAESNYELLYSYSKKIITNRSLLFLFTNFESKYNLERNIDILRKLNKVHLLVVIFFENTELSHFLTEDAESLQDIYKHTIAEKFRYDKLEMMQTLRQYGIQTIYTKPENLTINSINKYLEIKARGLI